MIGLLFKGWQNNRVITRTCGVWGMSHFRASVEFWKHQALWNQVFFLRLQGWKVNKENGAEDDLILPCSFSYHQPLLRYNGSKYLKAHTFPLILVKYCPDLPVQGRLNSQLKRTFQTYFDLSQDVLRTPSPWQFFSKTVFFRNISKTVRDIEKSVQNHICWSIYLQLLTSLAHFGVSSRFWVVRVRKMSSPSTPN